MKKNDPLAPRTRVQEYNTQYFKTHFAQITRDISNGRYDAVRVMSHGRCVGIFIPPVGARASV